MLFALANAALHGYAIMQQVGELSDGSFRIGPGVLYTTLQRLLEAELIEESRGNDSEDQRRRLYRLTPRGRALLKAEFTRMEALLRQGRKKELARTHAG